MWNNTSNYAPKGLPVLLSIVVWSGHPVYGSLDHVQDVIRERSKLPYKIMQGAEDSYCRGAPLAQFPSLYSATKEAVRICFWFAWPSLGLTASATSSDGMRTEGARVICSIFKEVTLVLWAPADALCAHSCRYPSAFSEYLRGGGLVGILLVFVPWFFSFANVTRYCLVDLGTWEGFPVMLVAYPFHGVFACSCEAGFINNFRFPINGSLIYDGT